MLSYAAYALLQVNNFAHAVTLLIMPLSPRANDSAAGCKRLEAARTDYLTTRCPDTIKVNQSLVQALVLKKSAEENITSLQP